MLKATPVNARIPCACLSTGERSSREAGGFDDPRGVPKASPIRRHARWIAPLLLAPIVFYGCVLGLSYLNERETLEGWSLLAALVLLAGIFVAPIVLVVVSIVKGGATYRDHRRSKGRYSSSEVAEIQRRDRSAQAWRDAQQLHRRLLEREVPPTLAVWDVVPYANEEFFCDVPIRYARYYGMDVSYTQTSGFFYGRPSFVLTGLAITAVSNAAQRSAAQNMARAQWREHCFARLVVSNFRLLVQVSGRWLSFDYAAMTAVFPEPASWGLVCQFSSTEPLLLTGDHAPFAAVMTLFRTHGEDALREHPGLGPLVIER